MQLVQWRLDWQEEVVFIVASEKGLTWIGFKCLDVPMAQDLDSSTPQLKILQEADRQLREYFCGQRNAFDLPLDAHGTDFQKSVWRELSKIPYGKTCSYLDIAKQINKPKAVRAVGAANGKNPLGIVIPCHRVIGSSGALTGYAGGLRMKTQLLGLEKFHLNQGRT